MSPPLVPHQPMLLIVTSMKLIVEVALMALFGQWVLGWLAGRGRDGNFFYRLLQTVASPPVSLTRRVVSRVVPGRYVPLVAFAWLVIAWVVLTWAKVDLCLRAGMGACR